MKASGLKIFMTTLLLTSTVIWLKIDHRTELEGSLKPISQRRNLVTKQEYKDLCLKNASNSTDLGFAEDFVPYADTIGEYIKNFSDYKDKHNDKIYDIIVNENDDEVRPLVLDLFAPFIVFAIFGIITLIAWLFYSICCCKPCCCCKSTNRNESLCSCKGVSCLIFLIATVLIVVGAVIGFIFSSDLPKEIDNLECALLKFYTEFKYGDDKTSSPRWIGLSGIISTLDDVSSGLDQVFQNSQGSFSDTSSISNSRSGYYNLLDAKYNENRGATTRNPNPSGSSGSVTPAFIQTWGPTSESSTALGQIKIEYDTTIDGSVSLINQFDAATQEINKQIVFGKNSLDSARKDLEPLEAEFEKIEIDYIDEFRNYKDDVMEVLEIVFIALFAVEVVLSIIYFLFAWMFVSCDKSGLRIVSHVAWHIITLITIPMFIIGSLFGLLGTAFIYMAPFMEILLSPEGMATFIGSTEVIYLDTCLNKGGNLKDVVFTDTSYIDDFDRFYNISFQLDGIGDQILETTDSRVVTQYKDLYTKMDSDIALAVGTDGNAPNQVIADLTTYTSDSIDGSRLGSCGSTTDDFWVSSQSSCPTSFNYITSGDPTAELGNSNCLNVREWTGSSASTRYQSRPTCDNIDTPGTVSNFVTSLNNYGDDASPILNNLKIDLDEINNSYANVAGRLRGDFERASRIYDPILDILKSISGENGLFNLLNCKFLADDIGITLEVIGDAGPVCVRVGAMLAVISLLNWFTLFCGLIYIFRTITSKNSGEALVENKPEDK
eukprot:CAMPEP_0170516930 /NCGR_PEP_ID=MMETSP0209-20121228/3045_1 /TAXON_ID=665100 ORGANISM="Litonotus pictus, Strain P1" /NCGR_SAMPLE_ID=MMETSP0209 /ASSEMBLY_ACC=CAM_ASM_000301 /LENGTH=774 /DNA_ID=CAMNT_0010802025 /DNA_START=6 /DNA_END=2330 /DNA_ORIENTATION=+